MIEVVGTTGTSSRLETEESEMEAVGLIPEVDELVSRKKNPLVGSSKRTSRHLCPEKWKDV